jgi:predicted extracellular nuclease
LRSLPRLGLAATAATAVTLALAVPSSAAPSQDALIAEVYGGGGNSGATLTSDFVELANRGSAPVSVSGWSVQYLSASPGPTSRWQVTPLTGSLAPGGRFLVGEATGTGGTVALPTPDATGTIAMSGTSGTIALVAGAEALTCLTAADCAADPRVRDLVGYGSAVVREGANAPAASSTSAVARAAALTDTDDNAADFTSGAPTPTNAAGDTVGGPDPDPEPDPDPQPGDKRIHDVQGAGRVSPLAGQLVTGVPGTVTAVRNSGDEGFWIQDTAADGDPRTSEGVFVYTNAPVTGVAPGDAVLVTGTVAEYRPGGATSGNQTLTELTSAKWTVLSRGNPLPAAEVLDRTTVPDSYAPDAGGGSIEGLPLDPAAHALDFYESREGMLLRVDDARVVGASNSFGETWITVRPDQNPTGRGGTVYTGYDQQNSGRLKINTTGAPLPVSNVGDVLRGATTGALEYTNFGGYTLSVITAGEHVSGGIRPETTRAAKRSELSVATYNVENLAATNDQAKFDRLGAAVVRNLSSPDVVVLEEIQDDNGAVDDGTVTAGATLAKFTDAIVAAGGPRYSARQIDPQNKTDGGEPGGNIRVAFLFDPARVSFADRPGGDATTPVSVVKQRGRAALSVSPGRIDPANPAWANSRKPLAGEFVFRGRTVFVVANHFNSKGGDQPMHGVVQPPVRGSEVQRQQQAATLRAFVDSVQKLDRGANVVLAGDINDYQFSPAVRTLTAGGAVVDLIDTLPEAERYGYVFEGNSQVLDHIFLSRNVTRFDYDVVHVNAEFADQASDHDPQVLRMRPSTGNAHLDELIFCLEDLTDRLPRP